MCVRDDIVFFAINGYSNGVLLFLYSQDEEKNKGGFVWII